MRNGPRDRRAGPPVPWIDPPVQFRIPHSTLRILYPRPRSSFKEPRQHPPRPHLPQLLRRRPRDAAGRAGQVARGGIPEDPYHLPHAVARVAGGTDRKSTRLNSSHANISYAVFCLKKKKKTKIPANQQPTSETKSTP